jgi:hypothetical protein
MTRRVVDAVVTRCTRAGGQLVRDDTVILVNWVDGANGLDGRASHTLADAEELAANGRR